MKKLTKLQRHTAYLIMLEEAEDETSYGTWFSPCVAGFCAMLERLLGLGNGLSETAILQYLPELYKLKPQIMHNDRFWFSTDAAGWQERIKLLQQCINETL